MVGTGDFVFILIKLRDTCRHRSLSNAGLFIMRVAFIRSFTVCVHFVKCAAPAFVKCMCIRIVSVPLIIIGSWCSFCTASSPVNMLLVETHVAFPLMAFAVSYPSDLSLATVNALNVIDVFPPPKKTLANACKLFICY